jgi:hypothetical protein
VSSPATKCLIAGRTFPTNLDVSVTEIPQTNCPNCHALTYPNVIVAHWPKPGAGKHVRAWHCLTCHTTICDDE